MSRAFCSAAAAITFVRNDACFLDWIQQRVDRRQRILPLLLEDKCVYRRYLEKLILQKHARVIGYRTFSSRRSSAGRHKPQPQLYASRRAMVFLLSAILGLPKWLFIILAAPTCLWLAAYILPLLYIRLRGTQDLKKKYGAEWALVTGGSTGIGRAIAEALAQQGLNVVVQGLEPELTPAIKELQTRYASQQFVGVACSFAPGGDYLEKIKQATKKSRMCKNPKHQ